MFSKGRRKLSTGKGILGDSQFLILKDISRAWGSRRVWPWQIAYCKWYIHPSYCKRSKKNRVQTSLRDVLLMPAADYLCSSRGGGVYSVRVSGVCGSSNSVCLFQFISCIAVRGILQTIGLGGEFFFFLLDFMFRLSAGCGIYNKHVGAGL